MRAGVQRFFLRDQSTGQFKRITDPDEITASNGAPPGLAGLDGPSPECNPEGGADCNLTVVEVEQASVPEPTTALLLATGFSGLLLVKSMRRRRRSTVHHDLEARP